jgi:pimeloyl-ACP methyl ester carboxylesterase
VPALPTRLGPLNVEVTGEGPPAVLWHSLFVDSTSWTRLRPRLATRRRLILVDGPGHGPNPRPAGPFTLEDCAAAATDVLDHLEIVEPVDWLGNAWGGHTGVAFAAAHPARCRSLLAIASPIHALSPAERRRVRLAHVLHRLAGPGPIAPIMADTLLGREFRSRDPEAGRVVVEAFRRADRAGMRTAIQSISLRRSDLTDRLADVKAPALMVTGRDDAMCPPGDTAAWAARMPSGASRVVAGAGHLAPLFNPGTADLILDFWVD